MSDYEVAVQILLVVILFVLSYIAYIFVLSAKAFAAAVDRQASRERELNDMIAKIQQLLQQIDVRDADTFRTRLDRGEVVSRYDRHNYDE